MSKLKLEGNASGTGVITLTAPNTNVDRTITLPDSAGSLLDTTSTLDATKLAGALPAIDGSALTNLPISPAGKVLQVVSLTSDSTFSTTSSTQQNTGVSLAITPTSSTSKVLVIVSASVGAQGIANPACGIRRDTTIIAGGSGGGSRRSVSSGIGVGEAYTLGTVPITFLDSPATTSATTYHITISGRGGYRVKINQTDDNGNGSYTVSPVSSITLMEIGA